MECKISTKEIDIHHLRKGDLEELVLFAIVNACGPYHEQDYSLAEICIELGVHYIDLSDILTKFGDVTGFKIRRISNLNKKITSLPMEGNDKCKAGGQHLLGSGLVIVVDSVPTRDVKGVKTIMEINVK